MKKITRAQLRGKKLKAFCKQAYRATNEYGENDNRVFCYGLFDSMTDELLDDCRTCKANVIYATPLQ